MKNKSKLIELSMEEIEFVDGGVAPVLAGLMWAGGYIGTLQVAADFGRGLGRGFYDAIHIH